jgi:hypothetical protein
MDRVAKVPSRRRSLGQNSDLWSQPRKLEKQIKSHFNALFGGRNNPNTIDEEQVFASLIALKLKSDYGSQVSDTYNTVFSIQRQIVKEKGTNFSAEQAAIDSLRYLIDSQDLAKSDAADIKRSAFNNSQLDSNPRYLWDSIGETAAVKSLPTAFSLISKRLQSKMEISNLNLIKEDSFRIAA